MNTDCFIIGGGPSLQGFDFNSLNDKDVIAVNMAAFDVPNAKYFITVDYTFINKVGKEKIDGLKCEKVFVVDASFDHIKKIDGVYNDTKCGIKYDSLDVFDRIIEAHKQDGFGYDVSDFRTGVNSGYCALQLAIILGYKNIYLLGFDFGTISKTTHYHKGYGQSLKDFKEVLDKYYEKFAVGLKQLKNDMKVNVYSCSKISRLNDILKYSNIVEPIGGILGVDTFIGRYIPGSGHAHNCCNLHDQVFNCRMIGTFNILLHGCSITDFKPSVTTPTKQYWFVRLYNEADFCFGWAIRDYSSRQKFNVIEVLTKTRIPDSFKNRLLKVSIIGKWDELTVKKWADNQYWFQTFPFTPVQKANSEHLWKKINVIKWRGKSVLDIGCHYGFFSFKASRKGANVTGFEPNRNSLDCARTIRDNIIQQDVEFVDKMPKGKFDVVLYLSVYHQLDPTYTKLKEKIEYLKSITKEHLFVELIMPPMFPTDKSLTDKDIDGIVGGEVLDTYEHRVRGVRRIYHIAI